MTEQSATTPVDNETYDLLQTLTSKLEAIELYRKYEQDSQGEAKACFQELAQQDRESATRIMELLRQRLASS